MTPFDSGASNHMGNPKLPTGGKIEAVSHSCEKPLSVPHPEVSGRVHGATTEPVEMRAGLRCEVRSLTVEALKYDTAFYDRLAIAAASGFTNCGTILSAARPSAMSRSLFQP